MNDSQGSGKQSAAPPPAKDVVDLTADSDDDDEQSSTTAKQQHQSIEFGIVSYNLWFDPRHQARRMEAVSQAILTNPPRIIGMQEVTVSSAQTLFPMLRSVGYQIIEQNEIYTAYGCAMAMNVDRVKASGFEPFWNTVQARGLLWALVEMDGLELLFATTHLESPVVAMRSNFAPEREQQAIMVRTLAQRMSDRYPNLSAIVLLGDLNWDDERPRSLGDNRPLLQLLGENEWVDAWRDHNPHDVGYTYDGRRSPMLRNSLRRRLDRCLMRSNNIAVEEAELIGMNAIPGLEYQQRPVLPSDHYGLRVQLRFRASAASSG